MIIRVKKISNFTIVDNTYIDDIRLTLRAVGLMTKMLRLPKTWDYTIHGLVKIVKDGEASVRSGLTELEKTGYLRRERVRNPNGTLGEIEYVLTEKPDVEKPQLEKPQLEKPILENQPQISTNQIRTNQIRTNELKDTNMAVAAKIQYAEKVHLKKNEYAELETQFGTNGAREIVKILNDYKIKSSKEYANDYAAIRRWAIKAYLDDRNRKNNGLGSGLPRQMTVAANAIAMLEQQRKESNNNG